MYSYWHKWNFRPRETIPTFVREKNCTADVEVRWMDAHCQHLHSASVHVVLWTAQSHRTKLRVSKKSRLVELLLHIISCYFMLIIQEERDFVLEFWKTINNQAKCSKNEIEDVLSTYRHGVPNTRSSVYLQWFPWRSFIGKWGKASCVLFYVHSHTKAHKHIKCKCYHLVIVHSKSGRSGRTELVGMGR